MQNPREIRGSKWSNPVYFERILVEIVRVWARLSAFSSNPCSKAVQNDHIRWQRDESALGNRFNAATEQYPSRLPGDGDPFADFPACVLTRTRLDAHFRFGLPSFPRTRIGPPVHGGTPTMRRWMTATALALSAVLAAPTTTHAGLVPVQVSVLPEGGMYRFTYAIVLPTNSVLRPGDYFTIYDFDGFVSGSQTASGSPYSANWTFSGWQHRPHASGRPAERQCQYSESVLDLHRGRDQHRRLDRPGELLGPVALPGHD